MAETAEQAPPPLTAAEAWFQRRISSKGNMTDQDEYATGKRSNLKMAGSEKFMMEELQKIKKSGSLKFKPNADDANDDTAPSQDIHDSGTGSRKNLNNASSHKLMKFFAAAEDEIQAVVSTKSPSRTSSRGLTIGGGNGSGGGAGSEIDPQTDGDDGQGQPDPAKSQKKVEQFFGRLDPGRVS